MEFNECFTEDVRWTKFVCKFILSLWLNPLPSPRCSTNLVVFDIISYCGSFTNANIFLKILFVFKFVYKLVYSFPFRTILFSYKYLYKNSLSISSIFLSQTSLYLKHPSISNIPLY